MHRWFGFARGEWITLTLVWAFWAVVFALAGFKATRNRDPEAHNLHALAGLSLFLGVGCLRRTGKPAAQRQA